jgi:branched-chain amino acid transport system substrate-binding protein
VAALAAVAGGLAAAGCGEREAPFRIGVLADCRSTFGGLYEQFLAGAELPFVERGGVLRGTMPSAGVAGARAGGRRVELVQGCSEFAEFRVLVDEARRLIEREHVDVVVGGLGGPDGIPLRMLAHRYPGVAFVVVGNPRREVTTVDPAPNLYRFDLDDAQSVAGLGTYAYRRLHWRRAAIVADDFDAGWAGAAAFASEFCALGGRIGKTQWLSAFAKAPPPLSPTDVDGVAAFISPFGATGSAPFLEHLARRLDDPPRRLVLGQWSVQAPPTGPAARAVNGVTAAVFTPAPFPGRATRGLDREYRRVYPALPQQYASAFLTQTYYRGVEAVMRALEANGGAGGARLQRSLAGVRMPALGVDRLDANRQAVGRTVLLRLASSGDRVSFRPIRTVDPVDQTLSGVLPAAQVSHALPPCRRR